MEKNTNPARTAKPPEKEIKDIIIDANVMRLYSEPKDKTIKDLFTWLFKDGSLALSQAILHEYNRHGNTLIFGLIQHLMKNNRIISIDNAHLKKFTSDSKYKYTCNPEDRDHAKLVFLSHRKKLISFDVKLVNDVNKFPKISKIKPTAINRPIIETFYV